MNKDKTKKEYYVGGQNTYKTKEAFIGALKDVRYIPLLKDNEELLDKIKEGAVSFSMILDIRDDGECGDNCFRTEPLWVIPKEDCK